jgi:hypothetical protein
MDLALQIFGWCGSALLVVSLLQKRMWALRLLNLIASLALVAFNLFAESWPMVGMNFVVAIIDAYYLTRRNPPTAIEKEQRSPRKLNEGGAIMPDECPDTRPAKLIG